MKDLKFDSCFSHFKHLQGRYDCTEVFRKLDCPTNKTKGKKQTKKTLRIPLKHCVISYHHRRRHHRCQIWVIIVSSVPQGSFVSMQCSSLSLFVIPTCKKKKKKKQYFWATCCIRGSPPASRLGGWSVYVFNIFWVALLGNRLGVARPWVWRNNGRRLIETEIEGWSQSWPQCWHGKNEKVLKGILWRDNRRPSTQAAWLESKGAWSSLKKKRGSFINARDDFSLIWSE